MGHCVLHLNFDLKTTCNIRHHFHDPVGSLKIEGPLYTFIHRLYISIFSSALCYCTAELLSSVRPSVDIVFSETVKWIDTKFY